MGGFSAYFIYLIPKEQVCLKELFTCPLPVQSDKVQKSFGMLFFNVVEVLFNFK